MAELSPFAGVRYRSTSGDLAAVVAPPYDVVDEDQRASLEAALGRVEPERDPGGHDVEDGIEHRVVVRLGPEALSARAARRDL